MKITKMKVELLRTSGTDLDVVNAARVSFHKEHSEFDNEKDTKLIRYLAKHNHWSPFAHVGATFRIKAPIFVARQLVKHQIGLTWNEVSRRYVDDEPEFWLPSRNGWRARAENVKQGSSQTTVDVCSYGHDYTEYIPWDAVEVCFEAYTRLLQRGVAPEQARMILPQNTMTEWIWTGSLMAFARVCRERLQPSAQQETQEVAKEIERLLQPAFPVSWKALMEGTD